MTTFTIASAAETVRLSGRAMGTTWSVSFVQPVPPLEAGQVSRQISDRLEELEQQFSTFRPKSELSRFNAWRGTGWFAVSPEFARVAEESRRISALTGGAFDVTIDPLVRLWGFGPQRRKGGLPTAEEIAAALRLVGWRQLEVRAQPAAVRKTVSPGLSADFSSIAKGFASDAVGELLGSIGAGNHFVQVGGDVKTSGDSGDGGGWRTGIERPGDEHRDIEMTLGLMGQALSTSGDTRNFFTANGKRYGHIFDPRTGWPATSSLASVSVVAPSCAESSALATGLFVLGPEEGFELAVRRGLAALFLRREGEGIERRMTPAFEKLLRREGKAPAKESPSDAAGLARESGCDGPAGK